MTQEHNRIFTELFAENRERVKMWNRLEEALARLEAAMIERVGQGKEA